MGSLNLLSSERSRFLAIYGAAMFLIAAAIVVISLLGSVTTKTAVDENGIVETATVAVYFLCFLMILFLAKGVRLKTRFILAFVFLCLIAREIGLPGLLGMPAIQFSMFRNPRVSLVEKLSVVIVFAGLAYGAAYLIYQYAAIFVRSAIRLEPIALGAALGLGFLSVAQILDRINVHADDADVAVVDIMIYALVAEEMFELAGPTMFLIASYAVNRTGHSSTERSRTG